MPSPPLVVLDKDGVMVDVVGPALRAVKQFFREAFSDLSLPDMSREGAARHFSRAHSVSSIGQEVGLFTQIAAYFLLLSQGRPITEEALAASAQEVLKRRKDANVYLARLYMEMANAQPPFPEAVEALSTFSNTAAVLSSALGVVEWLREHFGEKGVKRLRCPISLERNTLYVSEGLRNKAPLLFLLSHAVEDPEGIYFLTDTVADVEMAERANAMGGRVVPVGLLTGLSSEEEFRRKGVAVYPNILEAFRALGLI